MDLPNQYLQNMQNLLGDEYPEFAASFSCNSYHGLRVNNLKIKTEEISHYIKKQLDRIAYVENGYYYNDDFRPAKSSFYNAGLFYLQEPSAMLPADRLPINEGDLVLDLCAAPGGKSTAILSKLNSTGFLLSNDYSYSRAQALLKNLELFGGSNYAVCAEDPDKLAGIYKDTFDKIIVDAPCSGEGMFRKDPSLIKDWVERGPEYYAPLQRRILESAVSMLKPGGMLMYSTCTFSPLEDEDNINNLLSEHPECSPVNINKNYGIMPGLYNLSEAARVFPNKVKGEGHFLCLIQKKNDDSVTGMKTESIKYDAAIQKSDELKDFIKKINKDIHFSRLFLIKDSIYYLPDGYETIYRSSVRFLRTGLLIGEIDKNRHFKPSTSLALSLKVNDFSNTLNLSSDDIRVEKYLKGETVFVSEEDGKCNNGIVMICVDDFGLGFGKLSGNIVKNLLGKGYIKN